MGLSTLSNLCPLSSNPDNIDLNGMPRIKPRAVGWEAQTLPLCLFKTLDAVLVALLNPSIGISRQVVPRLTMLVFCYSRTWQWARRTPATWTPTSSSRLCLTCPRSPPTGSGFEPRSTLPGATFSPRCRATSSAWSWTPTTSRSRGAATARCLRKTGMRGYFRRWSSAHRN